MLANHYKIILETIAEMKMIQEFTGSAKLINPLN